MKNTKWLRRALLGGAALCVMATGAQADELAALKAQLEVLQSRVSQLETQPAPQMPEGTKLLTVRRGQGAYSMLAAENASDRLREHQGYTIAVTPTADMPAPVSEVTVSGEIRVRALYQDYDVQSSVDLNANDTTDIGEDDFEYEDFDITTRARLRVDGKTETAIGEIGGTIRLQGTRNGVGDQPYYTTGDEASAFSLNIGWGYWQMTPNLQLGGGYWDSAAAIQAGWDWNGEPSLVGLDAGPTNKSVSQFRLTYSNGPLTGAISVEDNNNRAADCPDWSFDCTDGSTDPFILGDAVFPAVAGFLTYDAGSFLVTAAGVWEQDDSTIFGVYNNGDSFEDTDDNWMVGIGAILKVNDMFRLEGAANIGEGYTAGTYGLEVCNTSDDCENDFEYWGANAMAVVTFTEGMRLELGGAYTELEHEDDEFIDDIAVEKQWTVAASMFWDPVDQLTLGAGVGFTHKDAEGDDDDDGGEYESINAGVGAWFRF